VSSAGESSLVAMHTAERMMSIYRDGLIPQAETSKASAMAAYRVGKVDSRRCSHRFSIYKTSGRSTTAAWPTTKSRSPKSSRYSVTDNELQLITMAAWHGRGAGIL